ncbi:hypothetical protein Z043_117293, partial [Scleropages formosus]
MENVRGKGAGEGPDGRSSRKRTPDTDVRSPSDRKRTKHGTGKMHKKLEKSEKHSGSTKIKHLSIGSRGKPLQEPQITSSEELTCRMEAEAENSVGVADPYASHLEEDSYTSHSKISVDLNSNLSAYDELYKSRFIKKVNGSAAEQEQTSSESERWSTDKTIKIKHRGSSEMLAGD